MASAAVRSTAVFLLLFIHCLLLLPFVFGLCLILQYFVSFLVAGEETAGCFTFIVF